MRKNTQILSLIVMIGALGCDDPADDVAAATVHEGTASETPAADDEPEQAADEPAAAPAGAQTLAFSNEGSSIGFTGSKVTASHEGGFREFAGTIAFVADDPTQSQLEVTIQTASIYADEERLTNHLKSDEFFDVENIPTATFRSTAITAGGAGAATHTVTGSLTLHGVTQTISFPATVTISDTEVAATSEFSIDRQDFGISYPGMPDNLIRDEVVIRFDLHAPRS